MNKNSRKKHKDNFSQNSEKDPGGHELRQKIEDLREQLNQKILKTDRQSNDLEILKLSQQLDELIAKYLKSQ